MSAAEIDAYLDELDEPKRSTLSQLRRDILAAVPDAEQCISYAVPGFKVAGKTIAGFAAFKNHLSYLPHSGSVFPELASEWPATRSHPEPCDSRSTGRYRPSWSGSSSPCGFGRPSARAATRAERGQVVKRLVLHAGAVAERSLVLSNPSGSASSAASLIGTTGRLGTRSSMHCRSGGTHNDFRYGADGPDDGGGLANRTAAPARQARGRLSRSVIAGRDGRVLLGWGLSDRRRGRGWRGRSFAISGQERAAGAGSGSRSPVLVSEG